MGGERLTAIIQAADTHLQAVVAELKDVIRRRMEDLADEGVHGFALDTLGDLEEEITRFARDHQRAAIMAATLFKRTAPIMDVAGSQETAASTNKS